VTLRGDSAEHVVALLGDLGDGELGTNAAAARERVTQRQASDLRGNPVGEEPIEPALRARSGDFVLGERAEIDETDALAHEARFVAHVLEVVAAPETPAIPALHTRRSEPVGALPAIALPPHRDRKSTRLNSSHT